MIITDDRLKDILLKNQLIDKDTLKTIEAEAKQLNLPITDILFGRRIIDRGYFMNILSVELGVKRADLKKLEIPIEVLQIVPEKIAIEKQVIPFASDGKILSLAMSNPEDLETISLIANVANLKVEPFLASKEEIQYALTNYQKIYKERYKKLIEEKISDFNLGPQEEEITATRVVDNLLGYAMGMNASDIHMEVMEEYSRIRFRVDGVLREIVRFPKAIHPALIAKIKVLSNLQLDEHFKPLDGRFKTKLGDFPFDIRVSIIPTMYGEKAVLRLLAVSFRPTSLDELGTNQKTKEILERIASKAYGMVLVTGPTGSGKTTTLYTVLQQLNRPEVNVCTIEDPIEYELHNINQTQINPKVDLTFATGLRAFLRQDPNIIMVGEIRDFETADIAIQAALTGHLLLSTLHTNDAPSSIPRILDLGVPGYLLAATISLLIAQRLTRKICIDCIYSEPVTESQKAIMFQQLKNSGLSDKDAAKIKLPGFLYKGKGCQVCSFSGYYGRTGIFEAIEMDEELKNYLSQKSFNLQEFRVFIRDKKGFRTMFEDGLEKLNMGITTIDEVLRVIKE